MFIMHNPAFFRFYILISLFIYIIYNFCLTNKRDKISRILFSFSDIFTGDQFRLENFLLEPKHIKGNI